MKKPILKSLLVLALAIPLSGHVWAGGLQSDQAQSDSGMKQDVKNAGRDTGRAAKKGAKKVKKGTKKGGHTGAKKTREGANKVEDKTDNK